MDILDFGKQLLKIRKARGLTQAEVAEKCNVTVRTIQRIESGAVNPRSSTIKISLKTLTNLKSKIIMYLLQKVTSMV